MMVALDSEMRSGSKPADFYPALRSHCADLFLTLI